MGEPIPLPGRAVRGSTTGRPIMALLDLLGRRWTLRILWELHGGPLGFRALQTACNQMSPTVLATRLGELRVNGLVETDGGGVNQLSVMGAELTETLGPLTAFATRWADGIPVSAPKA